MLSQQHQPRLRYQRFLLPAPIAGVKVGRINNEYVINPSPEMSLESELEIVVAGSQDAIVMVEGSAENVSEKVLLGAIMFGHESIQEVIKAQKELKSPGRQRENDFYPTCY